MTESSPPPTPQGGPPEPAVPPPLPVASPATAADLAGAAPVIAYATPMGMPVTAVWREGTKVVMQKDSALPPFCVRCAQPATVTDDRKFTWHHPAVYFALLGCFLNGIGLLVYIILALVLRKKATVRIPLCAAHHRGGRRMIWWGIATILMAFATIFGGFWYSANARSSVADRGIFVVLAGLVLLIVGAVLFEKARTLRPTKITDHLVYLKGASRAYLDLLPQGFARPGLVAGATAAVARAADDITSL